MSKYLINESPLIVLPSLARAIGLNEAIILQQLHYWIENPKAGVSKDGYKWVHNTYKEWQENFPFWSESGIEKIIMRLEKSGLVISAQFSPNPWDKTKSYRIDYDVLEKVTVTPAGGDEDTSEVPSLSDTTTDTTNTNMASSGKPLSTDQLPLDWQIAAGVEKISLPDEKLALQKDSANMIAMGSGTQSKLVAEIAFAFMVARGVCFPADKAKGQRKIIKSMISQGVNAEHVVLAVEKLLAAKMTVTDLYSVEKTAVSLANPAPGQDAHTYIEGV